LRNTRRGIAIFPLDESAIVPIPAVANPIFARFHMRALWHSIGQVSPFNATMIGLCLLTGIAIGAVGALMF